MTENRLREYEKLLRKLRQVSFSNDKAAKLIPAVKARCAADWQARQDNLRAKSDQRLLFRTS